MSDLQNSTDNNLVKGLQMKLYRATIFATPIIFGAMLIVLLCLLHIKRRRGMNDRLHHQGLMQVQVFTRTQVNLIITRSFKTITRFDKTTKIGEILFLTFLVALFWAYSYHSSCIFLFFLLIFASKTLC